MPAHSDRVLGISQEGKVVSFPGVPGPERKAQPHGRSSVVLSRLRLDAAAQGTQFRGSRGDTASGGKKGSGALSQM